MMISVLRCVVMHEPSQDRDDCSAGLRSRGSGTVAVAIAIMRITVIHSAMVLWDMVGYKTKLSILCIWGGGDITCPPLRPNCDT
jgi:uncharacterized protein (UPF0248 family)